MDKETLEAAIFDYGGVMALSPVGRVHMLADKFGANPDLLMRLILGESDDYVNPWFEAECGRQPLDAVFAEEMQKILDPYSISFDLTVFLPWVAEAKNEPDLIMDATVRWLKEKKIPVALLTNAVPEFRSVIEQTVPIYELFDVIVDSSEVGYRKPNPEIYQLTADRLGVSAGKCLMVDDLEHNVSGAERIGMTGLLFEDATQTSLEIRKLFP